ncbi:hypothetical protein H0H92_000892 [Tricholoma furcatifolium]|nr:hypothetical protein H0H92_000892 [Tricholoma furcatifolium]
MAPSEEMLELISRAIEELPILTAKDIPDDEDACPICLTSLSTLLKDNTDEEPGVTKLIACNHIFCRKDLVQWIQNWHGNCPTCRHKFLDISPPSESDDESSDGGEYIPDEDFDDEDDGFMDTDGFSDTFGYTTDDMEYDGADWGESDARDTDMEQDVEFDGVDDESEWGLTDGESAPEDVDASFMMNEVALAEGAQVEVALADQQLSDDLLDEPGQEK